MADSTLTMDRLRQMAPELQALTQAHGGSNLDVLVEFSGSPTFKQVMDLVTRAGLRAELLERIEVEVMRQLSGGDHPPWKNRGTPHASRRQLHNAAAALGDPARIWGVADRPRGVRD